MCSVTVNHHGAHGAPVSGFEVRDMPYEFSGICLSVRATHSNRHDSVAVAAGDRAAKEAAGRVFRRE